MAPARGQGRGKGKQGGGRACRGCGNGGNQKSAKKPTATVISVPSCIVCESPVTKGYKCPRCRNPFCGIDCCTQHKLVCTAAAPALPLPTPPHPPTTAPKKSKPVLPLLTKSEQTTSLRLNEWKSFLPLSDAHKRKIDSCDWLRQNLKTSVGLKSLITRVLDVGSSRGGNEEWEKVCLNLNRAKDESTEFRIFLDKLLIETGVCEIEEGSGIVRFVGAPIERQAVTEKKKIEGDSDSDSDSASSSSSSESS